MEKIILKNGKELIIKKANPENEGKMVNYKKQIDGEPGLQAANENEIEITTKIEPQNIESINNKNNPTIAVALLDGKIVGSIIFKSCKRIRVNQIDKIRLIVKKPYWGLGIGSSLLDFLIEWVEETGIVKKINLKEWKFL